MNLMRECPQAIIYLQRKGCKVFISGCDRNAQIHVIKPTGENGIVTLAELKELNEQVEQKYSLTKIERNEPY
jgi:hypothetical protein